MVAPVRLDLPHSDAMDAAASPVCAVWRNLSHGEPDDAAMRCTRGAYRVDGNDMDNPMQLTDVAAGIIHARRGSLHQLLQIVLSHAKECPGDGDRLTMAGSGATLVGLPSGSRVPRRQVIPLIVKTCAAVARRAPRHSSGSES